MDQGDIDLTPLLAAATTGNLPAIHHFLTTSLHPNYITPTGTTALTAALHASQLLAAQYLLSRGALITLGTPPPLLIALQTHSLAAVQLCLSAGAPVHDSSAGPNSILATAFLIPGDVGQIIWAELLNHGLGRTFHHQLEADIGRSIPCSEAVWNIFAAAQKNCIDYARSILETGEVGGSRVERFYFRSMIKLCIKTDRCEFLEMLVKALGETWSEYPRVLHIACLRGSVETLGAVLRVRGGRELGDTLLLAVALGDLEKVKLLLENGADPEKTNHSGWSTVLAAQAYNHTPILDFLTSKGSPITTSPAPSLIPPTTWRTPKQWAPTCPTIRDVLVSSPSNPIPPLPSPHILGLQATFPANPKRTWYTVHSDHPLPLAPSSTYNFTLEILSLPTNHDLHLGLLPITPIYDPDTTFSAFPGTTEGAVGYASNGTLYFGGEEEIGFGPGFTEGDVVGCEVDLMNRKVWFSVNGERVRRGVKGLEGLVWVVVMGSEGTEVRGRFDVEGIEGVGLEV